MTTIFWQYLALLATHWLADFVLQTHWQASNKSKSDEALARHVASYTAALGVVSGFMFGVTPFVLAFVLGNGILHFVTDRYTSRWSGRHFGLAMRDTHKAMDWVETYDAAPTEGDMRRMDADPGRHWHNFFVVIGFDQLIHHVTLAVTLWLLVEGFR